MRVGHPQMVAMDARTNSLPRYVLTLTELAQITGEPAARLRKRISDEGLIDMGGRGFGVRPEAVRAELSRRGVSYDFGILAHINLKGGVGKTTSTITIATRAAQYGFRTCVLDLDSQASASMAFDALPEEDEPIFYDIWAKPADMLPGSLKKIDDHLWLLPSSLENGLLDASLTNPKHQKRAVRGVCEQLKHEGFDLVLIDCPPSLGTAVISSICAANVIVIPVAGDPFSFKGLDLTLGEIEAICETYSLPHPIVKVLFSRYDRREKLAAQTIEKLAGPYANYAVPVHIRVTTEFSKSLARGETVFVHARKSSAREDYDALVRHLLGIDR